MQMRILIAYDGSISADAAIEDLPRAGLPQQADALVVCVADREKLNATVAESESIAACAVDRIKSYFPHWAVSSEALSGSPAKILSETMSSWNPDLCVTGSHGRSGVRRLFLGSVCWELIHSATCAVRVARPGGPRNPDEPVRIVIGVDGSDAASIALQSVTARTWAPKTEVHIVSAVQTLAPMTDALDASTFVQEPAYSVIREADESLRVRMRNVAVEAASALIRAGLMATTHVVDGDPREAILGTAEAERADAIFVGARGHGRLERLLLGSISSYIVTHAHCSVEVVRDASTSSAIS
jgi:nucleotide-binding universal stress UspA family protein